MALAAAQVADRVAAILVAAATAASSRVFTSRTWPLAEAELPALRVYVDAEQIEPETIDYPYLQKHSAAVRVQGSVQASADIDDAMHNLAEQVLSALFGTQANAQLQPLTNVYMTASEIDRAVIDGPADVGQITVGLAVQFRTFSNNPSTLV